MNKLSTPSSQTNQLNRIFFHSLLNFRAISVLLGEAWKNLQTEEREAFSQKAKVCSDQYKTLMTQKV